MKIMFFKRLPPKFQNFANILVLAAAICLIVITANEGNHKPGNDNVESAASNPVIHVTDVLILPG